MRKLSIKVRTLLLILLFSATFLSLFYLNKLEGSLREREISGASTLADTLSFLFRGRIQSLLVMLHSLNYVRMPSLEEGFLRDWLLVLYRAYEPFVHLAGFVDKDGRVVATHPKDVELEGKDISSWKAFKVIRSARISYVGEFITTSAGKRGIGVFAPVFDEERNFRGIFFYVYDHEVLIGALKEYLKAIKSSWMPLILDSNRNLIFGDERIANSLLESEMERMGSLNIGGVNYLFVRSQIPLSVTADWHLFLYAPAHSLRIGGMVVFLLVKVFLISMAIIIALMTLVSPEKVKEEISPADILELEEKPDVQEDMVSEGEEPSQDMRDLFPGILIELNGALDVLSVRGERIPLEDIDRDGLKELVKKGEGILKIGEKTIFFKVVHSKEGGFLLFGEDKTKERALLKTLENNLISLLSGELLKRGKDAERIKEVLLLERNSFGRVNLRDLLFEIKDKLFPEELEIYLEEFLPLPWVNPAYLKGIILMVLLRACEGKRFIAKASYLKGNSSVSLKFCVKGVDKLFKEEPELSILNSLASDCGIKLKVSECLGGEACVEMELPIYPPFEVEGK